MEFSKLVNSYEFSLVRVMFEKAKEYDDVVNMCLGEPCFVTPKHICQVAADNLVAGKTKYTSNAGIKELRDALAVKLEKENNLKTDPDKNLIVVCGGTEALLTSLMAFVNPGDEVIIPGQVWPNYDCQIRILGATPVPALTTEENGFRMTADTIEPVITEKTKMIMLCTPCNPTGSVLSRKDLEEIAELVKKHKLMVICDEVYEKIIYDGAEHVSLGSLPGMDEYVMTVNAFSKTYAMTGWRIGYVHARPEIIEKLIKLHEIITSNLNEAFQLGCVEALEHGEQDYIAMREHYDKNRIALYEGINKVRGMSMLMPKGSFYGFINVKELCKETGLNSYELALKILDEVQVVLSPGSTFGAAGEGYLRASFACSLETVTKACERLTKMFGAK